MEYIVLLVVIPIALLLLAVKPFIHALPQFNWVTCPKCRLPARRSGRRGRRRVYACEGCGARMERRLGRGARLIEADGDPPGGRGARPSLDVGEKERNGDRHRFRERA